MAAPVAGLCLTRADQRATTSTGVGRTEVVVEASRRSMASKASVVWKICRVTHRDDCPSLACSRRVMNGPPIWSSDWIGECSLYALCTQCARSSCGGGYWPEGDDVAARRSSTQLDATVTDRSDRQLPLQASSRAADTSPPVVSNQGLTLPNLRRDAVHNSPSVFVPNSRVRARAR